MIYSAAVAAAAAFNLVCSGTVTTESVFDGKTSKPYEYTYRIDLNAKKYCTDECIGLRDIADIQPMQITLSETKVDTPREHHWSYMRIDRGTGAHKGVSASGVRASRMILEWNGTCEKSEFTGFPTFETKF